MGFLKKIGKALKKPLLKAAQTAASIATGGLSDKAITIAKSAGAIVKRGKVAKAQKILDRLPAPQIRAMTYKSAVPGPATYISPPATAMPGGAPIGGARKVRRKSPRASLPKMPKKVAKKAAKKANKAPGGKGMKDLKALSVSWNAAGKPGKWLDWVKAH